jgi:hypothetical protein
VWPACGGAIDVPRLRDLEAFAVAVHPTASRGWRACHGWLLLAAAVAATAAAAAWLLGSGGIAAASRLPNADAIRAAVDAADAATIYKAWQAMRFSGVDRGALPEELRLQRLAGVALGISRMLWAIATLAGLVAAATAILCLAGDRGREREAGPAPSAGGAA